MLKKSPTSNPPPHTSAGVEKTPVIHTHVVEGLDSTKKRNAPTRVHMYTQMRAHTNAHVFAHVCKYMFMHPYTQTHIHAYTYIYTCAYTRIYAHKCIHTCTRTSIHRQKISGKTPQRVKQYYNDCFYYHSWRNNVVIEFETLSSFLT